MALVVAFDLALQVILSVRGQQNWESLKGQVGSLTSEAAIVSAIKFALAVNT